MTAMLVGPNGGVVDRVTSRFEKELVNVVRVGHAAAACERLAVAMPQVVLVLGALHARERDELVDRATAVGALVMYIDPELDAETLEQLVARAAQLALERKFTRDSVPVGPAPAEAEEGEDVELDPTW
jgi:hypothetical protein